MASSFAVGCVGVMLVLLGVIVNVVNTVVETEGFQRVRLADDLVRHELCVRLAVIQDVQEVPLRHHASPVSNNNTIRTHVGWSAG